MHRNEYLEREAALLAQHDMPLSCTHLERLTGATQSTWRNRLADTRPTVSGSPKRYMLADITELLTDADRESIDEVVSKYPELAPATSN